MRSSGTGPDTGDLVRGEGGGGGHVEGADAAGHRDGDDGVAALPGQARQQYANLLREIANSETRPIVFHCSHGVHRTGTASAILLWALGVPWETIRADYLLSNEYRREEIEKRLAQLRQLAAQSQGIEPADVDMTNINAFYILKGKYIDATRDWILSQYGSIEAYLREGLGLSDADITRLRDQLLE